MAQRSPEDATSPLPTETALRIYMTAATILRIHACGEQKRPGKVCRARENERLISLRNDRRIGRAIQVGPFRHRPLQT